MSEQTNRKQRALSGWRRWIFTRTVVSCRLICSPSLNLTSNGVKSSTLRDEGGSDPSDETGFRSTESSFTNVWLQQVWIRSTHQHRPEVRREVHLIQYFTEEEDEDGYIRNKYKRFIFWVINCSVSKIAAWISWIKSSESFFWSRSESWHHQQQAPEQQTTKSKYVYSVKLQKYLFESVRAAHVKQTSPSIKFTIRELKTLQVWSWKQLS